MIERRMIRTLVVSGGPQFFYYNGKPRGLVAELLVLLQAEINQGLDGRLDQVEIVPMPVSRDQLIPALLSGQADLIAADLTVTEARSALVDFSIPLVRDIDEILVFAPGMGEGVDTLDDLSGRSIYVRWSSSYFEHLSALNAELAERGLAPVQVVQANEFLRPQDILEMVNAGLVSATIIDSYKASYWSELLTDNAGPAKIQSLRRQAAAEGRDPNVWIENVELLAARKIGRETVRYVRNIFKYYVAYRLAFETAELRRSARDVQIR
jgi:membrane-bound lytic murein transglycosylase MltF